MPGPVVPGPIPYTAIDAWARRHGFDAQAFALFVDVIAILDEERAERLSSELRIKEKQREAKTKRRQP